MSDSQSGAPRKTSQAAMGPARAIISAILVAVVIIVVGGFLMFHGPRASNPISTTGSAAETTAPGDRVKGP